MMACLDRTTRGLKLTADRARLARGPKQWRACLFLVASLSACTARTSPEPAVTLHALETCRAEDAVEYHTWQLFHRYQPYVQIAGADDWFASGRWLYTPTSAPVTSGQAGNHSFRFLWEDGDGLSGVCVYRGTGSLAQSTTCSNNGSEYRLLFCTTYDAFTASNCDAHLDTCAIDPGVLAATPIPHGGLIREVISYRVEAIEGDRCRPTSATFRLTTPVDQDWDGIPDCLQPDTESPTWPVGSALAIDGLGALTWTAATDNVAVAGYRMYQNGLQIPQNIDGDPIWDLDRHARSASFFLIPGAPLNFRVQAFDAVGNISTNGPTNTAPDTSPPEWPPASTLSATVTGASGATLVWTAATDNVGVSGYRVYQDGAVVREVPATTLTTTLAGLAPEITYSFQVQAVDMTGNVSAGGPTTTVRLDGLAPTWPSGSTLAVSETGAGSAILVWTPATDNVAITGYRVYRDGSLLGGVGPDALSFHASGLATEVTYTFKVEAVDGAGNLSTGGPATPFRMDGLAPTWPAGSALSAVMTATGTVALTWTEATDSVGVAGFRVYRDGTQVVETAAHTASVSGLEPGMRFVFQVQAFDAAGNESIGGPTHDLQVSGAPSLFESAYLQANPSGVSRTVDLFWGSNVDDVAYDDVGIVGYEIYLDGALIEVTANPHSARISGLTLGTHWFELRARDADFNRSPSLAVETTLETNPPTWPPESVATAGPSGLLNVVALSWTPANDDGAVVRYTVLRNGNRIGGSIDSEPRAFVTVFNDTTVSFEIEAIDRNGNVSTNGPTATVTIDRLRPTWPPGSALTASSPGPGTTTLHWTPAQDEIGITHYSVLRNGFRIAKVNAPERSFDVIGLLNASDYTFQVRALDAWGNESSSGPTLLLRSDTTAPVWPLASLLSATQVDHDTVLLMWTAALDDQGVTTYRVSRDGLPIRDVPGGVLSTSIAGLASDTSYEFGVKAVDSRGNVSAGGPAASLILDGSPPTWPPGSSLTGSATDTTVSLEWSDAEDNIRVAGYRILLFGTLVRTVLAPTRGALVFGLEPDTVYAVAVEAFDAAGHISNSGPTLEIRTQASGPPFVAPPLEETVATTVYDATAFIYTGADPVQRGVGPGTIAREHAALVRGRVRDRDGRPLGDVTISVLDHPEFGSTETRGDGEFHLVVNGGEALKLAYFRPDRIVAERGIAPGWKDTVWAPDVVLVPLDEQVTEVWSDAPGPQLAQGSVQEDGDGTRRATLIFPSGTTASMTLPDGTLESLSVLHVRATEFTVGPTGPRAMPATLPPSSAYTYAVELSADEALEAGATRVTFDRPISLYVENFLGFPVGEPVPVGYYDMERAVWVASDSGWVVRIVDVVDGLARLDTDGDGVADNDSTLAQLGIAPEERAELAASHPVGASLWRVAVDHFTPWDINWAALVPATKRPIAKPRRIGFEDEHPCERAGSIVSCETQTLGESVGLDGTGLSLPYSTVRARTRTADRHLRIPLTGTTVPPGLQEVRLEIEVAGQRHVFPYPPEPSQTADFLWDGRDDSGRMIQGATEARVRLIYSYPLSYGRTVRFGEPASAAMSVARTDSDGFELVSEAKVAVGGYYNTAANSLGGWGLSGHATLDPSSGIVYHDDGRVQHTAPARIERYAWVGGLTTWTRQMVPDPKGGIYMVGMSLNLAVWHVDPDGNVDRVAGNQHVSGFAGDGGPALDALFGGIRGIALGPDGSLYILDAGNCRIRKVGPDGIVRTIAGTGANATFGDGGPAIAAGIHRNSADLVLGLDGSLYFGTSGYGIRRVGTDGRMSTFDRANLILSGTSGSALAAAPDGTIYALNVANGAVYRTAGGGFDRVAGDGTRRIGPDGGLALATPTAAWAIAVDPDGTLYLLETESSATPPCGIGIVRKVDQDGRIATVAGTRADIDPAGIPDESAVPPLGSVLCQPFDIAVGPGGRLYISDVAKIARVSSVDALDWSASNIVSNDGTQRYVFDGDGRHLRTEDPLTGTTQLAFEYDDRGRIASVDDGDGNQVTIDRSSAEAIVVTAPLGQLTQLGLDTSGHLGSITNEAGDTIDLGYRGDLLESFSHPSLGTSTFNYDSDGLLERDASAGGGSQDLDSTLLSDGSATTLTTGLDRRTSYETVELADGSERKRVTTPDGLTTEMVEDRDHGKTLRFPDGAQLQLTQAPDPLFGIGTLNTTSVAYTTPAGRTLQANALVTHATDSGGRISSMAVQTTLNQRRTATRRFDAATRTITTTSPAGRQTFTVVDARGRPTTVEVPGVLPTTYTFDARGRTKTVTQGERQVIYDYDNRGNLATITMPGGAQTRFTYDDVGRPLTVMRPDDEVLTFSYAASGRHVEVTPPGKLAHVAEAEPETRSARYLPPAVGDTSARRMSQLDIDGLLASITYGEGAGAAQMVVARDDAGRPEAVTTPRGTFSYDYSRDGHLEKLTSPEGEVTHYTLDGALVLGVTVEGAIAGQASFGYDNDLRLTTETVNGSTIDFVLDDDDLLLRAGELALSRDATSGVLEGMSLRNVITTLSRNDYGEVNERATSFGELGVIHRSRVLTRDAEGRILSREEMVGAEVHEYGYAYDEVGRLTDVTVEGTLREHYDYDANGNRVFAANIAEGTVAPCGYDNQDRLVSQGDTLYAYTADGALESKTHGATGTTTTYEYDLAGNLLGATLPSGSAIEYVVDAVGRRLGRKRDGVFTHRWVYGADAGPAAEVDDSGHVITRFVYGRRSWVPEYMVRGDRTYALVTDDIGSVRFVVDADSGEILQRIDYDAFGRVRLDTRPGFQPFGFGGGLYDTATGLTRLGARDYDAQTGRWTTKDPLLFGGGDANLYAYAANDPVNLMDPSGLSVSSWFSDLWLGAKLSISNIRNGNEDPLVDAAAGFGDALTFGVSAWLRGGLGLGQFVRPCSDDYKRGVIGGTVASMILPFGAGRAAAAEGGALKLLTPGLKIADRQFGRKVAQHAADFGLEASSAAGRSWMRSRIEGIVRGYSELRQGAWRGGKVDYLFYREGADVVITTPAGEFVTVLSDGVGNSWFNAASRVFP